MAGGDVTENARVQVDAAKRELQRLEPLHAEGIVSTRDYNAALNILDAAGLAESLNARGDSVRLHLATAGRSNSQGNANHRHHNDAGIPML